MGKLDDKSMPGEHPGTNQSPATTIGATDAYLGIEYA